MQKVVLLAAFPLALLCAQAQSPNIAGVWKADLPKSKIAGPPPTLYLEIIEEKTVVIDRRTQEKGEELDETCGVWGERGERRSLLAFVPNGKPAIRSYQGIPARMTASWHGNTLNLTAEVAGRPMVVKRSYELSADGEMLTINSVTTAGPRQQQSTFVLMKQPDSAGEPLRQPEQTAEQRFKNLKTDALKTLPASQFIDQMRYIAWAVGKDCEFCHVKDHFDSDDKKEKKTAREMIDMTASIDDHNFKGRPEVRCFTCHEGRNRPLSHPLFPDEAANLQSAQGQGPHPPMQGAGSGPQGARPGDMPPGKPPNN